MAQQDQGGLLAAQRREMPPDHGRRDEHHAHAHRKEGLPGRCGGHQHKGEDGARRMGADDDGGGKQYVPEDQRQHHRAAGQQRQQRAEAGGDGFAAPEMGKGGKSVAQHGGAEHQGKGGIRQWKPAQRQPHRHIGLCQIAYQRQNAHRHAGIFKHVCSAGVMVRREGAHIDALGQAGQKRAVEHAAAEKTKHE